MGFCMMKIQVRMSLPGALQDLIGEIDAYSIGWLCGSKQIPCTASYFEYALAGTDQEFVDLLNAAVVPASHTVPCVALAGDRIPV